MRSAFRHSSGFTLVEMIVAVAISVAIAAVLIAVATTSLGVWNRSNARWATAAVANAVLDQVQSDLTSAVFQSNGGTEMSVQILSSSETARDWLNTTTKYPKPRGSGYISVTDPDIAKCRFGTGGTWMRLFVGSNGNTSGSSLQYRSVVRAVSYQIVRRYQTSKDKELAYILFRSVAGESQTIAEPYDFSAGKYGDSSHTSGSLNDVGNLRRPNLVQALADHVADFGVRFYSAEGGRLEPLIPASGGVWSNSANEFTVRMSPGDSATTPVPAVAEVMVRILTDEGVQRLRLYENPPTGFDTSGVQWWDIVEQHSHVYVRRFWIGSRGP